ncbi:MAG: vWA domain-containing protein [Planctomycetota bacterium]
MAGRARWTVNAAAPAALALVAHAAPQEPAPPTVPTPPAATERPPGAAELDADAGKASLRSMAVHGSWLRRMVSAMRLERPGTDAAREFLLALAVDPDPRVRSAAVLSCARAGIDANPALGDAEQDPRVLRNMLRCGWQLDAARIERGARILARSDDNSERLLAVELIGALQGQGPGRCDERLADFGKDTLRSVIARLDRDDGGALSPRIAALTGARDSRQDWKWRIWLDRNRGSMRIDAVVPARKAGPGEDNAVAKLDDGAFVRFAGALDTLFRRPIDLGVAIDCTGSMAGEIAQAQAGIDDLMRFVNAVTAGLRVGIVGYRDQQDDFKTLGWDFAAEPPVVRERLWKLSAEGGGDEPELVQEALKVAYGRFTWRTDAQQVMVLVGDAPPTPGWGTRCVEMAREARARGITREVLSDRDERQPAEVKHFPDIARAGGGRVIRLDARTDLAAELAGLALSDTWHDQVVAVFERYLLLCR